MKITVLGKYGPYPAPDGACSGYLVEDGNSKIVLDMGCGVLSRLMKYVDIQDIDCIFISHLHNDHTSDLLPLRYYLEEKGLKMNIVTAIQDDDAYFHKLFDGDEFNVISIDESKEISIGDMSLSFYKMHHTTLTYGIKIKGSRVVAYTADSMYCENVDKLFEGSDMVIADITKQYGVNCPHMNTKIGKELAGRYSAKIIASHIGADYNPSEEYENIYNIEIATEMKQYEV